MADTVMMQPQQLETEYLRFIERPSEGSTAIVDVQNKIRGGHLGVIRWYGARHQYVFVPAPATLFNGRCLADIYDVLGRMMKMKRENRKRR